MTKPEADTALDAGFVVKGDGAAENVVDLSGEDYQA